MKYLSTRGQSPAVSLSAAIAAGLAPDRGLYVPEHFPSAPHESRGALSAVAETLLAPFAAGDALAPSLGEIVRDALNFPAALTEIDGADADLLELFHGPTAAFKDFGARFLAAFLARARAGAARPLHILVATSGDTGGAVAAAFHLRPGMRVSVLYPKGMVSPAQERQLTCWGGNVAAFAVRGAFDDCQRLVKTALADARLAEKSDLSSANSINVGRLLPQMTYFAKASFDNRRVGFGRTNFVIPSGNLGHATACVWARAIGCPIGQIVLAHNANRTMVDYLDTGEWRARPTLPTLASAMDVGDPSNAERLRFMFPAPASAREAVSAYSIDDAAISGALRRAYVAHGLILCPHSAAAFEGLSLHRAAGRAGHDRWVVVATADASKFPEVVTPIIGRAPPEHPALAALGPSLGASEIGADYEGFLAALQAAAG